MWPTIEGTSADCFPRLRTGEAQGCLTHNAGSQEDYGFVVCRPSLRREGSWVYHGVGGFYRANFSRVRRLCGRRMRRVSDTLRRYGRAPYAGNVTKRPVPCRLQGSFTIAKVMFLYFFLTMCTLGGKGGCLCRRVGDFFHRGRETKLFSSASGFGVHCALDLKDVDYVSTKLFMCSFFSGASPFLFRVISRCTVLFVCVFYMLLAIAKGTLLCRFVG